MVIGAAVDGRAFDDAEAGLHQVSQEPLVGEVRVDPRVGGEPVADLDALVGGVVVHHQVQLSALAVPAGLVGLGLRDA